MNRLKAALRAELLKTRRSNIFPLTVLVSLVIPVMCGFMMWIIMHPELATRFNIVKAKADLLISTADWPSFFRILLMMVAMGGLFIFGFVASWVFGREYTDRTVKDILSLPVSRTAIVLSKFAAITIWCFLLSSVIFLAGLVSGFAIDLPGWSPQLLPSFLETFAVTAAFTILLGFPVGLFASIGRGYLLPLAFVLAMVALAQFIVHLGWGAYFPWSIPALYTGIAGSAESQLDAASFVIMFVTVAAGLIATVSWWVNADQK